CWSGYAAASTSKSIAAAPCTTRCVSRLSSRLLSDGQSARVGPVVQRAAVGRVNTDSQRVATRWQVRRERQYSRRRCDQTDQHPLVRHNELVRLLTVSVQELEIDEHDTVGVCNCVLAHGDVLARCGHRWIDRTSDEIDLQRRGRTRLAGTGWRR